MRLFDLDIHVAPFVYILVAFPSLPLKASLMDYLVQSKCNLALMHIILEGTPIWVCSGILEFTNINLTPIRFKKIDVKIMTADMFLEEGISWWVANKFKKKTN